MKLFRTRKVRVLLVLFLLVAGAVTLSKVAVADSWSWASGTPVTESVENSDDPNQWDDVCKSKFHGYFQQVLVDGTYYSTDPMTNCVIYDGDNFKLYSYDGSQSLAIQFNGDKHAHMVAGVSCASCAYNPSDGSFIEVLPLARGVIEGPVYIYNDFVSHLQLENTQTLDHRYYSLTTAEHPDRQISGPVQTDKYFGYVKDISLSANGRWLFADFDHYGFFRVNLATMQMVKFSNDKIDFIFNPVHVISSVSDDGQRIALFGENSENEIYEINSGCGNTMPASPTESDLAQLQTTQCPIIGMNQMSFTDPRTKNSFSNLHNTYDPEFSDDGGELSFYATSNDNSIGPKHITIKATGYAPAPRLDYLALGDSYTSGEGDFARNGAYYRTGTDVEGNKDKGIPQEKCHLSTRSYPYLLASSMKLTLASNNSDIGSTSWQDVSCSGAQSGDVNFLKSESYQGQGNRLKGYDFQSLQTEGLNEFIPGRDQQIQFVKKYKPKVITLTMGGNDVDFVGKLSNCVKYTTTCDYANSLRGNLGKEIVNEYDTLKALYTTLHKVAGSNSKIYVIGYPNVINSDQNAVCQLNVGFIDGSERQMMANGINLINTTIKQAAVAAGVKYIDIEHNLDGHRLCDTGEPYENGIARNLNQSGFPDEGSFHPNAKGHQAIANAIIHSPELAGKNLLDADVCPYTNQYNCPDPTATKESIQIPSYFQNAQAVNTYYKQMSPPEAFANGFVDLVVGSGTFLKDVVVQASIHSEPVQLGSFTASDDGSLSANLTIPADIRPGFHTILLSGVSSSGDPVDYEQLILIKSANPNDIDGDGIPDSQDKCLFVPASGVDSDGDGIDDACDPQIGGVPTEVQVTTSSLGDPILSWSSLVGSDNYNIYRDGSQVGSIGTTTYTDTNSGEGVHLYQITAVQSGIETDYSSTVSVVVNRIPQAPQIFSATSPTHQSAFGWTSAPNVSSYNIYRDGIKIASSQTNSFTDISAPEGSYMYTITAIKNNSESSKSSNLSVFVDKTAPTINGLTLTGSLTLPFFHINVIAFQGNSSATLQFSSSDIGSGVARGEYFIDSDPGKGRGYNMTINGSKISKTIMINSIPPGYHTIYGRAKDKAGNYSSTVNMMMFRIL